MKKFFHLVASLSIICGLCAAVLAYVNDVTKDAIRDVVANKARDAVKAVLPSGAVTLEQFGEDVFVGKNDKGAVIGYAAKGIGTGGYGGDIVLMVGFNDDGQTLVGYRTLSASETPGLGMKLNAPEFAGQFADKNACSLSVRKDGGEIEAITSATITSRAVCRALSDAQARLSSARKGH